MLFNSYEFLLLFLPITLVVFYLLLKLNRETIVVSWLVVASIVFYSWFDPRFLILLGVSIIFNFVMSIFIRRARISENSEVKRKIFSTKILLTIAISANLLVLMYYKYFLFIVANLNSFLERNIVVDNIVLPIGISFFTFTQIAFLVDTYRGENTKYNLIKYILFVTFFPHLIAGPILHHKDMMPQFCFKNVKNINWQNLVVGIVVFILGLFKKVIIADKLATFATPVFMMAAQGKSLDFTEAWIGALAYSFQLYFDFSGYSDMAVGLGLMFNIKLPMNFFSPYKAVSIIDFWRRWHMTLSKYLKDYLYIPLGGNRLGEYHHMKNLFLTMLLGGIWHGAGWTFIIWGILHGCYLIINHLFRKTKLQLNRIISWLLTFQAVVVAWVVFRAENMNAAMNVISGMYGINGIKIGKYLYYSGLRAESCTWWLIGTFIVVLNCPNIMEITAKYRPALGLSLIQIETKWIYKRQWEPNLYWSILLAIIGLVSIVSIGNVSEFLYFQF